jgi:hypothetical protein
MRIAYFCFEVKNDFRPDGGPQRFVDVFPDVIGGYCGHLKKHISLPSTSENSFPSQVWSTQ